ncbi:MAG: CHAT domain-containing protein [Planctomycetota bacterium]
MHCHHALALVLTAASSVTAGNAATLLAQDPAQAPATNARGRIRAIIDDFLQERERHGAALPIAAQARLAAATYDLATSLASYAPSKDLDYATQKLTPLWGLLVGRLNISPQDAGWHQAALHLCQTGRLMHEQSLRIQGARFRQWAELAWELGRLNDVRDTLTLARQYAKQAQKTDELAIIECLSARLQCKLGRLELAASHAAAGAAHADQFAKEADSKEQERALGLQRESAIAQAEVHLLDGDIPTALDALENWRDDPIAKGYVRIFETLSGNLQAEEALEDAVLAGEFPIAIRRAAAAKLVQVAMARNETEHGFERLEAFSKSADLADSFGAMRRDTIQLELALQADEAPMIKEARSQAEGAFDALLDRWRELPLLAGGSGFLQIDDRADLLGALVRAAARDGKAGSLRALEYVVAAHAAAAHKPAPKDATQIMAELTAGGRGALIYLPGRMRSGLLAVDGDGIAFFELRSVLEMRPLLQTMATALAGRLAERDQHPASQPHASDDEWLASARDLGERLLPGGLRQRIAGWQGVSIHGAGMLQNASFDVLPISPNERDPRLGEQLPVTYVANLVVDLQRVPARSEGNLLFAMHVEDQNVPAQLTEKLVRSYRKGTVDKILGDRATVAAIRAALPTAKAAHIVAHGDYHSSIYRRALRLHDGEMLAGEHVVDLKLDGLVVILGSCEQGLCTWRAGGNPLATSLAGAMLEAGANSVLVPTTEIRTAHHLEAMRRIYDELDREESLASAVHLARRYAREFGSRRDQLELLLMQVHGRGHGGGGK